MIKSFVKRGHVIRSLTVRTASSTTGAGNSDIRNIVVYDGVCNLCNAGVRFVLARTTPELKFCPAQTTNGAEILNAIGITHDQVMKQFAYIDQNGTAHRASTAALYVAKNMTWPWPLASSFLVVPVMLRDPIYDLVATYRYNLFGKTETCQVPPKKMRDRFLM